MTEPTREAQPDTLHDTFQAIFPEVEAAREVVRDLLHRCQERLGVLAAQGARTEEWDAMNATFATFGWMGVTATNGSYMADRVKIPIIEPEPEAPEPRMLDGKPLDRITDGVVEFIEHWNIESKKDNSFSAEEVQNSLNARGINRSLESIEKWLRNERNKAKVVRFMELTGRRYDLEDLATVGIEGRFALVEVLGPLDAERHQN